MKEITTTHQVHSENPFDEETLYKVQVTTKLNKLKEDIDRKELTNQLLTSTGNTLVPATWALIFHSTPKEYPFEDIIRDSKVEIHNEKFIFKIPNPKLNVEFTILTPKECVFINTSELDDADWSTHEEYLKSIANKFNKKDLNKSEKLYKAQQIRSLLRNIAEGE